MWALIGRGSNIARRLAEHPPLVVRLFFHVQHVAGVSGRSL